MKVALYTIFRCTNYGAVLQAYALARTLRGLGGYDVDVLNHRMDPRDNHLLGKITNPNTPWFQRWRNRRKFAARYVRPDLFELRRQNMIRFIDEQIRPTGRLYLRPQEFRDMPRYDVVVVGSDQVWNPSLNHDFGCNQYLCENFPDAQERVAYGASFGVSELPPDCEGRYRDALSRFKAITVREETGADICAELLPSGKGRPCVVLDPTMLLTADDWRAAVRGAQTSASAEAGPAADGIVAYWVRTPTQDDVAALARMAGKRGETVRLMSAGPMPKLDFPAEVVPCIDAAPFDFVSNIADASAVVTDSFHGLQFAAVFKRPFVAVGDLSDAKSNASRLVDFCARYGLSGGVSDIGSFRSGMVCRFEDFSGFNAAALAADRERSMQTMQEMLP